MPSRMVPVTHAGRRAYARIPVVGGSILELDNIQSEWREPRFAAENMSRAGYSPAPAERQFASRAALKRRPVGLNHWQRLPFEEHLLLLESLAGAAHAKDDSLD